MQAETGGNPLNARPRASLTQMTAQFGAAREALCRWRENPSLAAHRLGGLWDFKLSEVDGRVCTRTVGKQKVEVRLCVNQVCSYLNGS